MRYGTVACGLAMVVVGGWTSGIARSPVTVPPVRPLGRRLAVSRESFKSLNGVRQLSDGRVLVDDAIGKRVLLFDSTLTTFTPVVDSSVGSARHFGKGTGPIIPYVGDTTLFFDGEAMAFVVIDPNGKVAGVMSTPFPPDAFHVTPWSRFDSQRRLIYGANLAATDRSSLGALRFGGTDSVAIVRVSAGANAPDTLGYLRTPHGPPTVPFVTQEGVTVDRRVVNPLLTGDDWTITSDGRVAIVRGQDYHIDWIDPDGTRRSSPKLPFEWHSLSDSEKVAIVDSTRAFWALHPGGVGGTKDGRPIVVSVVPDVVDPSELPAYRAPFARGGIYNATSVFGDAEGNVWIHPTPEKPLSSEPGAVYDVVNHDGVLIDRVQLPPGFTIVGFAPGVIYMSSREGSGLVLIRALIR